MTKKELHKKKETPEAVELALPQAEEVIVLQEKQVAEMPLEVAGVKIGHLLKEERLKKGEKTADIAQALCIRKNYLDAIEDSQYDAVPRYPYGQGFIKSYANYLGLDGDKIVQMYKLETTPTKKSEKTFVPEEEPGEISMPGKNFLLIALVALVAIYVVWLVVSKATYSENVAEEPVAAEEVTSDVEKTDDFYVVVENMGEEGKTAEEAPVVEQLTEEKAPLEAAADSVVAPVTPVALPAVEAKSVAEAEPFVPAADSGVVFQIIGETWIEVKKDDKLYISKILNAGDVYNVPNIEGLTVSTGRYDSVNTYVNGEKVEIFKPYKKTGIKLDEVLENLEH